MNKSPIDIIIELEIKFKQNFECWKKLKDNSLDKSFMYLKSVAAIGEILHSRTSLKHHKICCKVFDEIFADGVSAIYLAVIAMDKPANIVLRRILELGVAVVYLWDMPHETYAWNSDERDLSFSEMLKHLNSKGYLTFISKENETKEEKELFPTSICQKLYGQLSDTVHGKITTFESSLPNSFSFVEDDWKVFLELLENVLSILVEAHIKRFQLSDELFRKVPLVRKEFV